MVKVEAAESLHLAVLAAQVADELKARDVRILKIGRLSGFADYFVIASCQTRTQMRAVAHRIIAGAKEIGRHRLGYEGEDSENWMLLDYADVVVHLFRPEIRDYYNLERIWGDGDLVEWQRAESAEEVPLAR